MKLFQNGIIIGKKNKKFITENKKYGVRIYRIYEWFLAWSTFIAKQGNSTCYSIISHKNLDDFDRSKVKFEVGI